MIDHRLSGLVDMLRRRGLLTSTPNRMVPGQNDPAVGAIRYDSRMVAPTDVFVARRGQHADGHDHVAGALSSGAVAAIVEREVPADGLQLVVRDARAALGHAAAWRAGDPSRTLGIVGITGTDGKTTTAYLVRAILEGSGRSTGLVGTTDVVIGGRSRGNEARTSTPEAPELQGYLAAMLEASDAWAVVESTSHGLAQDRVAAVAYDVAVLTNITSEHLEFHGTLEAYRAAKHSLFTRLASGDANPDKGWGKHAVVNADDPQGDVAARSAAEAGASVLHFGLAGKLGTPVGRLELAAIDLLETPTGMHIGMTAASGWSGTVELQLAGRFNVYNALAAMGVASALGLDLDVAARSLGSVAAVPGRMQRVIAGQPFSVVIDYAHTAESLAKVLDELTPREPAGGLIVVFGSAGDRDTTKREVMGRVAGERCRLIVLTDEDPRGEDPMAIIEAIAAGAQAVGRRRDHDLLLIPDRAAAIAAAISAARPGDAVLLAGKGHEKSIEYATEASPWDEEVAARRAIEALA